MNVIPAKVIIKKDWWPTIFYVLCLLPVSIAGYGVNYLFVLIPIARLVTGKLLIKPRGDILAFIFFCSISFFISAFYQVEWVEYFPRRAISFGLFLLTFSFFFVPLSRENLKKFELSVVIAALAIALKSITVFMLLGEEAQNFESKDVVGSQRYGFVYILAFWILWCGKELLPNRVIRSLILILLVLGIALTFSRAAVVAFSSSIFFGCAHSVLSRGFHARKYVFRLFYIAIFLILAIWALRLISPVVLDFFYVRLIDYVLSGQSLLDASDPNTSDGVRVFIWGNILDFVARNPLTGSGFLGVWVLGLFEGEGGSSHSQYFDQLFRLGALLFVYYGYILLKTFIFFMRTSPGVLIGYVGVLVYGLFHETFKEPHGLFLLAFLAAFAFQRNKVTGRSNL